MVSRVFLAACFSCVLLAPVATYAQSQLVAANNRFGFELYRDLAAEPGNLVCSPFSVGLALSMVSEGARGNTAEQFASALHKGVPAVDVSPSWASLLEQLRPDPKAPSSPFELAIANGAWIHDGFMVKPAFLDRLRTDYGARLAAANFADPSACEDARNSINGWVAQQTKDKIKDLLPADAFSADTRMVLVNAVYFKGAWEQAFPKQKTAGQLFHLQDGREVAVPMMHHDSRFRHSISSEVDALQLPYRGGELSMIVLLPKQQVGLAAIEKALSEESLQRWLQRSSSEAIEVALPRFRFDFEQRLNGPLQSLGLRDAFSSRAADFSGIADHPRLYIDLVQHQAVIEVNEEGTEAAAATGINVAAVSVPPSFVADRPFLFLIRHRSGAILFLGRVANPLE